MDNIRVVLASASPRREELLRQIGIIPEVIPSEIEEKVTEKEPDRVVTELSRQKAEEVAARLGENDAKTTVVVGSDTVLKICFIDGPHIFAADFRINLAEF